MQPALFNSPPDTSDNGAIFSECGKYRYALWRIWNKELPTVMFIGLNPSTANSEDNDPTIESVIRLSKFNGFGGAYMMNCFPYISTDPKKLLDFGNTPVNDHWLDQIAKRCSEVVFAWGNFKIVRDLKRDAELMEMFANAKCILFNKNGSPGHPLFKKGTIKFIDWLYSPAKKEAI